MVREIELREILEAGIRSKDIGSLIASVENALSLLNEWIAQEEKWAEEEYQKFLREEVRTC